MSEEGMSSYSMGSNLREIQQELFRTSPDSDRMMTLAMEMFERLQSAVDLKEDETENEYQTFFSILVWINQLEFLINANFTCFSTKDCIIIAITRRKC